VDLRASPVKVLTWPNGCNQSPLSPTTSGHFCGGGGEGQGTSDLPVVPHPAPLPHDHMNGSTAWGRGDLGCDHRVNRILAVGWITVYLPAFCFAICSTLETIRSSTEGAKAPGMEPQRAASAAS
jgi:hypothetical protein